MRVAPERKKRQKLKDVMLTSNHTQDSLWARRKGFPADIAKKGLEAASNWSVSCHLDCIDFGTVCWVVRTGDKGCLPQMAGFIVCNGPVTYRKINGEMTPMVQGRARGLGPKLWVPGEDIQAAGWPAAVRPWGTNPLNRRVQGGEQLAPHLVDIVIRAMPATLVKTLASDYFKVTGAQPRWG